MQKLKIVGTRGKKRKRLLRLLWVPGAAVLTVCLLFLYLHFGEEAGVVFAGEGSLQKDDPSEDSGRPRGPDGLSDDSSLEEDAALTTKNEEPSGSSETRTVGEDERELSFGPISIGPNIRTGDYIDIRLMCADGTDYIVASKKELLDYNASTGMSVMRVCEKELLTLNSAMADRNKVPGVTLYAVRYIDPELQSPADVSYIPNEAVRDRLCEIGKNNEGDKENVGR